MNPLNTLDESIKLQSKIIAIEAVVTHTKKAKKLLYKVEVAKDSGNYTTPALYSHYKSLIEEALKDMSALHEKVNPDLSSLKGRSLKVFNQLKALDDEVVISTRGNKTFILSGEIIEMIKTLWHFRYDDVHAGAPIDHLTPRISSEIMQFDLVDGKIFSTILDFLKDPSSIAITKENIVELHETANYFDLVKPKAAKVSLSELCLLNAMRILKLTDLTTDFCNKPGFNNFARKLPMKFYNNMGEELLKNALDPLLINNFKNISKYVSSVTWPLGKTGTPANCPRSIDEYKKYFDQFIDLKIKQIHIRLYSGEISAAACHVLEKDLKDVEIYYQHELPLNDSLKKICALPNLYSLTLRDRTDTFSGFLSTIRSNIRILSIPPELSQPLKLGLKTNYPKLEELSLLGNDLSRRPDTTDPLPEGIPNLKILRCLNNQELQNRDLVKVVDYKGLQELDISGCSSISSIPDGFTDKLRIIRAQGTMLTDEVKNQLKDKYKLDYID